MLRFWSSSPPSRCRRTWPAGGTAAPVRAVRAGGRTTGPSSAGGRRHDGRSAKFRQNVARFRLYRHRFLQENMRFAAFFKIYQIIKLKFLKFDKILQILRHLQFFLLKFHENCCFFKPIFAKILRLQRCKRMQIL